LAGHHNELKGRLCYTELKLEGMDDLDIKYKFWLENNGEKSFGYGPMLLLREVNNTGSLRKASDKMGMSYNKAWTLIKKLEKVNGFPFLNRQIGGIGGGSSTLTEEAKDLVIKYDTFYTEITKLIEENYNDFF